MLIYCGLSTLGTSIIKFTWYCKVENNRSKQMPFFAILQNLEETPFYGDFASGWKLSGNAQRDVSTFQFVVILLSQSIIEKDNFLKNKENQISCLMVTNLKESHPSFMKISEQQVFRSRHLKIKQLVSFVRIVVMLQFSICLLELYKSFLKRT